MKLLWFTDLHLRTESEPGYAAATVRFKSVLDHALTHHADADRLIITGDIADSGADAQYRVFDALNADNLLTRRLLAGNHDDQNAIRHRSPAYNWDKSGGGFAEIVADYQLVYLDSHVPGRDSGEIGGLQRAWLDGLLATATRPALIFLHHHPGTVFLPSADSLGLEDKEEFCALLARNAGRIRHIFFGHCHRPISGSLSYIPVTGLPAVSTQMLANFNTAEFIPDPGAPPSYGIIIAEGDTLACHQVVVA